ncbi:Stage V sporulation protein G [uncultured Clostridium sp.]|jgi:stage V sporulation protein G|nr:Stage V sporulation protein G [uncultured Clostridium sp.]
MKGRVLMNITDIRVREVQTDSKMKAVASITFDNSFVVHDIKIVEGQEGMFIAMPSRKLSDGSFRDIAHPINTSARAELQQLILDKYQQLKTPQS